jgi:hypothetical protein
MATAAKIRKWLEAWNLSLMRFNGQNSQINLLLRSFFWLGKRLWITACVVMACRPTCVPDLFGLVIIKVMLDDPLILLTPERLAKFFISP